MFNEKNKCFIKYCIKRYKTQLSEFFKNKFELLAIFFKLLNVIRFVRAVFSLAVWRGELLTNGSTTRWPTGRPTAAFAVQCLVVERGCQICARQTQQYKIPLSSSCVISCHGGGGNRLCSVTAQSAQTLFAYAARHTHPGCVIVCSSRRMRLVSSGPSRFTTSPRAHRYAPYV